MADRRRTLAPGTEYTVTARVVPNRGKPHREHWTFTTVTPSGDLGVRVVPGDNEVVGVGQPISVRFTGPVANKAAVEERLKVTTSVPVEGSWRWMSDTEAHWRPRDYWPANTEVFFDARPDRRRRRATASSATCTAPRTSASATRTCRIANAADAHADRLRERRGRSRRSR